MNSRSEVHGQLHRGQAMPELLIVFPLAVIMIMVIIQFGLLYRAKATLNNATFLAARAGALDHGYTANMKTVFFERMTALMKVPDTATARAAAASFAGKPNTIKLTTLRQLVKTSHSYPPLEVLFPTKEVFDHFAVASRDLMSCSGNSCPGGGKFRLSSNTIRQIPNNNLDARNGDPQAIGAQRISLEDANLLNVRSRFCYALEVPIANYIIHRTIQQYQSSDMDWRYCQQMP